MSRSKIIRIWLKKALAMSISNTDLLMAAIEGYVSLPDVGMVFTLSKEASLRPLVLTYVVRELMT